MKKNGFTLIELLAVIIILGVIMLIAIPSVTRYINESRKDTYIDTARQIVKGAILLVNGGELDVYDTNTTYYIPASCIPTENSMSSPFGEFTKAYVIVGYNGDGYEYYWASVDSAHQGIEMKEYNKLTKNDVKPNIESIDTTLGIGSRTNIKILDDECQSFVDGTSSGGEQTTNPCTYTGTLSQGAEFVEGQYTYRYMQEGTFSGWTNMSVDGWGMKLTDKNSTAPVTTQMCSSINGKPIVSLQYAFVNSKTTSIDVNKLYTKDVINMIGTFQNLDNVTELDVGSLYTNNVENMTAMFVGKSGRESFKIKNICNMNTSNVTNMEYMFGYYNKNSLDLSCMNTSKVTTMYDMFYEAKIENLNISGWNNLALTNMKWMFKNFEGNVNLTNFTTPNVKNMVCAFCSAKVDTLDFSSFSSASLENPAGLFQGSTVRTIYASDSFDLTNFPFDNRSNSFLFMTAKNLVGGNGTSCIDNGREAPDYYARVDKPGRPGCFTLKN